MSTTHRPRPTSRFAAMASVRPATPTGPAGPDCANGCGAATDEHSEHGPGGAWCDDCATDL